MLKWYKDIQAILAIEPETWLAYLYGQQLENLPHRAQNGSRFRGPLLRLVAYFLFLLRHLAIRQPAEIKASSDYIVFSGTINQMTSLEETVDALRTKGARVTEIGYRKLLTTTERKQRYIPFSFSILDVLKSLILLFRNGPTLYRTLRKKHPAAINFYLDIFFGVYTYLVYFHRILSQIKPEFVITANDHNSSNRSLLAVAHYLGVKTVYLQHASVSTLFPALRVNYAFLDGQCAWDTYNQCEPNQPVTERKVPDTRVILSGQKKHLRVNDSMREVVGVALNALDDADAAIGFVEDLVADGIKVCVRWHPGQPERQIRRYQATFSGNRGVELSDPKQESVSDFFLRIGYVVAGNSSIHLEAALAGILPIYYELSPADHPDYYGYVKNGLSKSAKTAEEVSRLIEGSEGDHRPDVEAIRYYSSTYLTEWDGREGELVAECLRRFDVGEVLPVQVVGFEEKAQTHSAKRPKT